MMEFYFVCIIYRFLNKRFIEDFSDFQQGHMLKNFITWKEVQKQEANFNPQIFTTTLCSIIFSFPFVFRKTDL